MARLLLDIPAGTTETVASGETQDTATVTNAGTFENAGTQTVGGLDLQSSSVDIDAASGATTRVRSLASSAIDIDTASATLTRTRTLASNSADIDAASAELFAARAIRGVATDVDAGSASLDRTRTLSGTSTDVDALTTALERLRSLASESADVDAVNAELERIRELASDSVDVTNGAGDLKRLRDLSGTASDPDKATGLILILVVPQATRPVATIEEILEKSEILWQETPPDVQNYWDVTQQERTPGADQPPRVYVWQPASESHDRFSLDSQNSGTSGRGQTDDTTTVECLIYSLDPQEVVQYADDVRDILQFYYDDNKELTNFQTIEPSATNDYREQNNARQTEAYVMSVEVDLRGLQDAAELPEF
jgi:hypothetical protein